jgi:biopolymer transport protein ExbD
MARKHRFEPEPMEEPALDISSLIDVSFLMLIYFLVTSAMTPREGDLSMELPTDSGKASAIRIDPLKIGLNKEGVITVGGQAMVDDRMLAMELDRYKKVTESTDQKAMVVVSADDEAKQQRFADLMNHLSRVGITTITLSGFKK